MLEFPRSSFYHASKPTSTQRTDLTLGLEIEIIFKHHRRRYGYRRIHSDLADKSIVCAASRVRRIMEERKLRAIQPKTYVPKTSDGRADKPSPNLLLAQPLPEQPNKVWAGDITHIPTTANIPHSAIKLRPNLKPKTNPKFNKNLVHKSLAPQASKVVGSFQD